MIAVVLKNFVLFLMLLLICHYTIQLHAKESPASKPLARRRLTLSSPEESAEEEQEQPDPLASAQQRGMQELYDFVFEDTEAPKNLENMYANQIQVSRSTGGDPQTIDTFVSAPKGQPREEPALYVSSGGFEVVGELEEDSESGMYRPAAASSGEFSSNLFKI